MHQAMAQVIALSPLLEYLQDHSINGLDEMLQPHSAGRLDLDSEELGSTALTAFFNITQRWGLSAEEERTLLGAPPRSTFFKWKSERAAKLSADTARAHQLRDGHLQGAAHPAAHCGSGARLGQEAEHRAMASPASPPWSGCSAGGSSTWPMCAATWTPNAADPSQCPIRRAVSLRWQKIYRVVAAKHPPVNVFEDIVERAPVGDGLAHRRPDQRSAARRERRGAAGRRRGSRARSGREHRHGAVHAPGAAESLQRRQLRRLLRGALAGNGRARNSISPRSLPRSDAASRRAKSTCARTWADRSSRSSIFAPRATRRCMIRTTTRRRRNSRKPLRDKGHWGLVYRSVRHDGGECIAAFKPQAVSIPMAGAALAYVWDGERVSKVYEKSEVLVRAVGRRFSRDRRDQLASASRPTLYVARQDLLQPLRCPASASRTAAG